MQPGFSVKFPQIRYYTTSLNRFAQRSGLLYRWMWDVWFSLGAVVSLVLFLPAILFLMYTLLAPTLHMQKSEETTLLLQPAVSTTML